MSIFENINRSIGEIKEKIETENKIIPDGALLQDEIDFAYNNSVVPKLNRSDYLKASLGWVYGCVGVISDEVASIDLRLLRYKNKEVTEIEEHPALDVLYRANNAMSRFDLISLTFQYLELTGEAPWFISFKNGKPDQIFILKPNLLTVKQGKNGEIIGGYKYKVQNEGGYKEIDLEPFEVVFLKYSDPDNPLRGKGPLQASAITYDLDGYAERWNSQFFKNSASPASALETDKVLAKDVRERLQKKLKERYQGLDNSHKTIILENGLKFKPMSLTQKDMDFIEQQRFSRDKIMAIFRVPRTALGITDDVNRANAEATDYVFAKRTIKPKMRRFVEQLNEFYLPLFANTEQLYFDFTDPVPQNVEQNIAKAQSGVNTGYMTINEAREVMGLEPIEGGDELRDPIGFAPVSSTEGLIKGKKKNKEVSRYIKQSYATRTRAKDESEKRGKMIEKAVQKTVLPMVYGFLKQKGEIKKMSKMFSGETPEARKEAKYKFQEKQLNVALEYEDKFIKKLNSAFNEQEEVIKRAIESGERKRLLLDVETDRYLKLLRPVMIEMMREQARMAFQIIGVQRSFDGQTEKELTFLQTLESYFKFRVFKFAREVTKETNDKLGKQFSEATKEGESIPQIKKRITALFDDMKGYRSERIARTETIRATNFASEQAYADSEVVEAKEWLATRDERTDDECVELDGKIIPLGKNYLNKREAGGYEAVQFPPLHVNCRCTIIPVLKA